MNCEEIDKLQKDIHYLQRQLTNLVLFAYEVDAAVSKLATDKLKEPQGLITFKCPEDADRIWNHLQRHGLLLEKSLRELIEEEIKEVGKCKERDRCNNHPNMMKYWDGMRVGYTNIRCWLDQRD
jgi:hypothetical protein